MRAFAAFEPIGRLRVERKSAPRLCRMIPVSPATRPDPNALKMLWMNETTLRSLSTTVRYTVSSPPPGSVAG